MLASANEYFKALFTTPLTGDVVVDEENRQLFTINGVSGDMLELLINFCYCGEMRVAIDDTNVDGILEAANVFQFDDVRQMCETYLKGILNATNCLGICALAEQFHLKQLDDDAFDIAKWNFKKVINGKEFLHMQAAFLQDYLSVNDLNGFSEEQIIEAIISWIEFDEPNRKDAFPDLLETIRLSQLKVSVSAVIDAVRFIDLLIVLYFLSNSF